MVEQVAAVETDRMGGAEIRQALGALHEQGRITLELLRNLITMLMPKEDVGEGPTLEELLARITAQLTQVILLAKLTQGDLDRLGKTLPEAVAHAIQEGRVLSS